MPRISINISTVAALTLLSSATSALATPNCLRDNKPYRLAGDTIEWSMTIAPGANCIQGLRWSTMQIFSVSVVEKPKNGDLLMVGPGFRYFARSDFTGTDKFTLVVVGKNRHDEGKSTVQITVSKPTAPLMVSVVSQPD
ncbi:hypothetical protein IC761_27695 [Bradyrhizobium commune]|uniref:Uncharacterized protein n=2 Tax=Bradyrhizobium commune TaxID=83627 RepID=A0A7S9DCJ9_9BRAD|nr:hypothetical protein IC761_27695 [Bradyrhizobium commune]